MLRFYGWNGRLPEFRRCRGTEARKSLPGIDENIIEQEHGHIATETIAALRQGTEQLDHYFLGGCAPIIELNGICPGGEIRIFAMGEPEGSGAGLLSKSFGSLGWTLHE